MNTSIRLRSLTTLWLAALSAAPALSAEEAVPLSTFTNLPVREITVFKDGHAFVAHEGELPTDAQGNVVMDYLPAPVIGTFWPYAVGSRAVLKAVVAGQRPVAVDRLAQTQRELLEANIGAEIIVTESGKDPYAATIMAVPGRAEAGLRSSAGPALTVASYSRFDGWTPPAQPYPFEKPAEKGNIILLKTAEGIRVVSLDRIQDVTFKEEYRGSSTREEFRQLLTLRLDWGKARPAKSARVGLFYLQKGVRWIPSYKVELDGKGNAVVKMQATLLNELADMEDVSVNLVVGVPSFAFKDTLDPMGVQQGIAQLSQYFQSDLNNRNSPLASQFSNALMSQTAARTTAFSPAPAGNAPPAGPEVTDADKTEDLFVFRVEHVTLRRGERMVLPVAEFTLPYKDVFTLEMPFAPPPEVHRGFNTDQQRELARLFSAPKVLHKARLTNKSKYPLTTAPALILRDGRVLAQGMMTYTSAGADVDLTITTAVDLRVKKTERETKRTPEVLLSDGCRYVRVELDGKVTLTNYRSQTTELEVTRYVLGTAAAADHDGKVEKLNVFENGDYLAAGDYPYWWGWYGWPYWWNYFNGVARVNWKVTIEPGQAVDLGYQWHYFWR